MNLVDSLRMVEWFSKVNYHFKTQKLIRSQKTAKILLTTENGWKKLALAEVIKLGHCFKKEKEGVK